MLEAWHRALRRSKALRRTAVRLAAWAVNGEGMDAAARAQGRIWLDVTTTKRMGGKRDGTTRVESSLIRELPGCLPGRLGFFVYDRTFQRFAEVARPPATDSVARGDTIRSRGAVARAGKAVEQTLRRGFKAAVGRTTVSLGRLGRQGPFPASRPGDTLLLAGETWSRHDFSALRRLRREGGVRIAAVLQDMIPSVHPQFFEPGFQPRFQAYVDFLAGDADLVLAISDSTRADFLSAASSADPSKAVRIELGSEIEAPAAPRRPDALEELGDRPFALSVSTMQVRKNFDLLYRLWQQFAIDRIAGAPHLVIVGRPGFGCADLLHQMRNDPWIAGSVTILDRASDAELAWLYRQCAFTLYPSWYEGWGLPISESLAYGKTFVASDRSSMPEAGQGLGVHLDPYDLAAWRTEILRLAGDRDALAAMEARILSERRLTGWADCARTVAGALDAITGPRA